MEKLVEERKEEANAKIAFRILYRLMFAKKGGRPKYPEFTWSNAQTFLRRYGAKS
jgi:hypothetical protein